MKVLRCLIIFAGVKLEEKLYSLQISLNMIVFESTGMDRYSVVFFVCVFSFMILFIGKISPKVTYNLQILFRVNSWKLSKTTPFSSERIKFWWFLFRQKIEWVGWKQCIMTVSLAVAKEPYSKKKCPGFDTKLHLMVRLQFWRSLSKGGFANFIYIYLYIYIYIYYIIYIYILHTH